MIDLYFSSPSKAAFDADMVAFLTDNQFPELPEDMEAAFPFDLSLPALPEQTRDIAIIGSVRIDFIVVDDLVAIPAVTDDAGEILTPAVTRGWHCTVRLSEGNPGRPTDAFATVHAAALSWFGKKQDTTLGTPADVQSAYGITDRQVNKAEHGTKLIHPAPAVPKTRWSGLASGTKLG